MGGEALVGPPITFGEQLECDEVDAGTVHDIVKGLATSERQLIVEADIHLDEAPAVSYSVGGSASSGSNAVVHPGITMFMSCYSAILYFFHVYT